MPPIELFKKVSIDLQAGDSSDAMNLNLFQPDISFIFGIGTGGLTPFEYLLAGQPVGRELRFQVASSELQPFFERLATRVADLFSGRPLLYFTVRVKQIETPEPREIVRALAETTAHGAGGCDCGCDG